MHGAGHSGVDTIIAPASGTGRGARALIRMSGPAVGELLRRLLDPPPSRAGRISRSTFKMNPGTGLIGHRPECDLALRCLVMRSDGPRSFTGEDAAELLIPGNPMLVDRVVSILISHDGVRLAQPGEFSARAYLAGKMTIEQAEGIAARIAANTDAQLAAADRLLDGSRGREYRTWVEELATLLALVEAGIDFSDQEDVVPIAPDALRLRASALRTHISEAIGAAASWERTGDRPRAVLIGEPNAGKSTLFNALLGRRRAVVSDIAGTTRDAVEEALDLNADATGTGEVLLYDLPGFDGAASGGIDAAAQARARAEIRRADVLIHCDPAGRFELSTQSDADANAQIIRVRTKADLAPAVGPDTLGVCAIDGWNIATLRRAIADAVSAVSGDDPEAAVLPRHRRALLLAIEALDGAIAAMPQSGARSLAAPELVAAGLRACLDHMGEITGNISPDDVLGRVFAVFCVGK